MRRVVVTGMGTVNPIGLNVDEYWEGLKAGKTGFGEITYFDTTDFKVKVAAEVKGFVAASRLLLHIEWSGMLHRWNEYLLRRLLPH